MNLSFLTFALLISSLSLKTDNAYIKFDNFLIEIEDFKIWSLTDNLQNSYLDTCIVQIELGEVFEGKKINLIEVSLTNVKVEQRFETSLSVMNEGPHCDLINWKHYLSEWEPVKQIGVNTYQSNTYTEVEKKKFPVTTPEEITNAVQLYCPDWSKSFPKISSPNLYPSEISISKYYLKISGSDHLGNFSENLLIVQIPMGC